MITKHYTSYSVFISIYVPSKAETTNGSQVNIWLS